MKSPHSLPAMKFSGLSRSLLAFAFVALLVILMKR